MKFSLPVIVGFSRIKGLVLTMGVQSARLMLICLVGVAWNIDASYIHHYGSTMQVCCSVMKCPLDPRDVDLFWLPLCTLTSEAGSRFLWIGCHMLWSKRPQAALLAVRARSEGMMPADDFPPKGIWSHHELQRKNLSLSPHLTLFFMIWSYYMYHYVSIWFYML